MDVVSHMCARLDCDLTRIYLQTHMFIPDGCCVLITFFLCLQRWRYFRGCLVVNHALTIRFRLSAQSSMLAIVFCTNPQVPNSTATISSYGYGRITRSNISIAYSVFIHRHFDLFSIYLRDDCCL